MLKWRLRARSRVQCSERELLRAVVLRFSAQNRVLCLEQEPLLRASCCVLRAGVLRLRALCFGRSQ